ncbi:hypothetical protein GUJ93_ZPchr0005g16074 [Zizania palustris]|uniref:Uncharacterized protein n=1 Tax=Zizania palustris TaxID=103762 RepID=A0A8J5SHP4_ZIZPA|nr:hypothetical protein GUJ93_ZPchr0005g16074 [Zizania palustris]
MVDDSAPIVSSDEDDLLDDDYTHVSEGPAPQAMDIGIVMLPFKFAPLQEEVGVTQLNLGPRDAVFEKPGDTNRHLRPLYISGHIDGKPISRMLVDGGATVNLMLYSLLRKLNKDDDDLKKTNVTLNSFNGDTTEAKRVLSLELAVGNKMLPTAFFIVDVQGNYNVLLGRDWIHANQCVSSTLHQRLIQWDGDEVEIVYTDASAHVSWADASDNAAHDEIECLSGRDLSNYDFVSVSEGRFVPIFVKPVWLSCV